MFITTTNGHTHQEYTTLIRIHHKMLANMLHHTRHDRKLHHLRFQPAAHCASATILPQILLILTNQFSLAYELAKIHTIKQAYTFFFGTIIHLYYKW